MAQIQPYVGIDISKDRLDIHIHPTGEAFSLIYDQAGLDPAIQNPLRPDPGRRVKLNETSALLDRRVEPGDDGECCAFGPDEFQA